MIIQQHLRILGKATDTMYMIEKCAERIKDYSRTLELYNSVPWQKQCKPASSRKFYEDKLDITKRMKTRLLERYANQLRLLVQDAMPKDYEQTRFIQTVERYAKLTA